LTIDDYEKILEEHELYMSDCMLWRQRKWQSSIGMHWILAPE
jgi:hypothetical protein